MKNLFPLLNDNALLWVWISDRKLSGPEQDILLQRLAAFCQSWTSHDRPVRSETTLLEGRLLLIAGNVDAGDISGCGIDKSVHILEKTASELGFSWLDGMEVVFRRPGREEIETAARSEFRDLAESGALDPETQIYDRNPSTVGRGRADGLTKRASETWTARYFTNSPKLKSS